MEKYFNLVFQFLGICYGLQLVMQFSGGHVHSTGKGEYGFAKINPNLSYQFFNNFPSESQVWMSHGDEVDKLPEGWEIVSKSTNGVVAAVQKINEPIFGVQFHPEVVHSVHKELLQNFLFKISNCEAD